MANFPDIAINVTAKQIEDKVKEPVEIAVQKGNPNPVASGAVAAALEVIKISKDNLLPDSVTSEKIPNKEISPDKLQEEYWKISTLTISTYSDLDNLIENENADKAIFRALISGLAPFSNTVGEGFFSIEISGDDLTLINHKTGKSWYYEKGSNKLVETLSNKMNLASTFYKVSGISETANPEIIAYQTTDPTTNSMLRIPLSILKEKLNYPADQNFNPESTNAQSGKAVEEAISDFKVTSYEIEEWDNVNDVKYIIDAIREENSPFNRSQYRGKNVIANINNGNEGEYIIFENYYNSTLDCDYQKITLLPDDVFHENNVIVIYGVGESGYNINYYLDFDYTTTTNRITNLENSLNGLEDFLATI